MQALIDGDLVAYRCSASVKEDEPLDIAYHRCDELIRQLLHETGADTYTVFLSDKQNFRKIVNPEYKANRKDQVPPQYLTQCKEFLADEWNATSQAYLEADDLLGISQTEGSVICTLDKDLLMVPGQHYSWQISGPNWVREARWEETKHFDGLRQFYMQMLIGDTSDNIQGIYRVGPKKAFAIIDHLNDEQEMFDVVYTMYDDPKRFLMNAQCLWIMLNKGETWVHRSEHLTFDEQFKQEVALMLDSMKFLMGDTSTALIIPQT